ncbi:hypothetical protein [Candidatus Berkiella aquae]|uniref:Uncharacterized protein n=1 Tax=Candidatus Berkiella aquae TaxID=295108 RepID=A0A0Q9YYZ4_9GAMM|nr:hypothetical protein [Candidatus Berkiella aquae]MCS5710336.1 hypothetical protein [Candidatus Berkiella aquae]
MFTLENAMLSTISGGCDECNAELAVETENANQDLLDATETSSLSLNNYEPIFNLE